ncbi:malonyl-[acyl-carrier protein] O-methyltransferase BioC [Candidatus Tenderia electrophaga]|jgi:malonyl-CoA O-methyltransferase|uniref:Malonyl-[acyl-carrier protein] O-methyltransferase n=1 Tax=Candidatus Tenderia electrophaga TaxID=1748243 RepID=A0A0S2T9G1_9GAMM|nr:malonyl-[acyl-carrier protein] O-methyltransferase BioC [Candidatus Tenderia electrophaga]
MDNTLYQLDKRLVRDAFDRAAAAYDEVAILQREVGRRLLERLDLIKLQPRAIVDIGAGTGELGAALAKRYKGSEVILLDLAPRMLKRARQRRRLVERWLGRQRFVCGDAEQLPLADNSVDMVFSNFAIQWCSDLDRAFAEFQRVLRPDGLLLFTSFGPDTLTELRQAWRAVDDAVHVNSFIDMHDIGDALMRAKLAEPVMDAERLTLTYADGMGVMRDLKAMGAHNVSAGRHHGLTGKRKLQHMLAAYEQFRNSAGLLPATYEVVYGHAWGSDVGAGQVHEDGTVHVPLSQLKRG